MYKKRFKTWRHALILCCAAASLATAHAQDAFTGPVEPRLYGQVGLGRAHLDLRCPGQAACDRSGFSTRLTAGVVIWKGWALEWGRLGVGNFDHKHRATDAHRDIEGEAWLIGTAVHLELSPNWMLVPRVGLASVLGRSDASVLPGDASKSARELHLHTGLTTGWRLNRKLSLQLQADYTRLPVRYPGGERETAGLLTLGLGLGINY